MHVGTAGKSIGQELAELTNLFLGSLASYFPFAREMPLSLDLCHAMVWL